MKEENKADETTSLVSGNGYGSTGGATPPPTPPLQINKGKTDFDSALFKKFAREPPRRRTSDTENHLNLKTQSSFYEDTATFAPGSIPHSTVLGIIIGGTCGVAAAIYYAMLFWMMDFVWHTLPELFIIDKWPEWAYVLWIPIAGFILAIGVGLTVVFLGEPGDLPYTIKCVHEKAYLEMSHVMPMVCASQFSIVAGGSLGPEAPLVAICASVGGFISRRIFGVTRRNLVRKHTLMGMASALAAFFGCPLGGAIFALEVNSRFGIEYFEHTVEAIFAGEVCLAVFRSIAGIPIKSIWDIATPKLEHASPIDVFYGCCFGLAGAFVAFCFAQLHQRVMWVFEKCQLLGSNEVAVWRALLGAVVVVLMGVLVPHTMFWGESEFQTIATMAPASTLEHVWPTTGLLNFEMTGAWSCVIVGCAKLVAISFTVSGGYRGGYIFPLMAVGAAFGRAIHFMCPFIPVQICVLCMAAALNVGITRTALASSLIMAYLSGEQQCITALVAACVTSLFATAYMPFIKTQIVRNDLDSSLYYADHHPSVTQVGGRITLDEITTPAKSVRKLFAKSNPTPEEPPMATLEEGVDDPLKAQTNGA